MTIISECMTSFLEKLKPDLRSRNLTIYAQWASILAAILIYVPIVFTLYLYANAVYGMRPWDWKTVLVLTLTIGPLNLLFPLMPIALELPQYIPQAALAFATIVSGVVALLRSSCRMFLLVQLPDISFGRAMFEVWFLCPVASFPIHVVPRLYRPGLPGVRSRLAINTVCFVQSVAAASDPGFDYSQIGLRSLGLLGLFPIWAYFISTCMFGVAVLLYGTAGVKRQPWVSSRLLGGTGIEPMVLVLPEWGPLHESVGDEAREGVIRL